MLDALRLLHFLDALVSSLARAPPANQVGDQDDDDEGSKSASNGDRHNVGGEAVRLADRSCFNNNVVLDRRLSNRLRDALTSAEEIIFLGAESLHLDVTQHQIDRLVAGGSGRYYQHDMLLAVALVRVVEIGSVQVGVKQRSADVLGRSSHRRVGEVDSVGEHLKGHSRNQEPVLVLTPGWKTRISDSQSWSGMSPVT